MRNGLERIPVVRVLSSACDIWLNQTVCIIRVLEAVIACVCSVRVRRPRSLTTV
jgi:hypothetical protein